MILYLDWISLSGLDQDFRLGFPGKIGQSEQTPFFSNPIPPWSMLHPVVIVSYILEYEY